MIRPYNRSGMWWAGHHDRYRRVAARALWELKRLEAEYDRRHDEITTETGEPGYAEHVLRATGERGVELANSVRIYAAMSVEAFLNYYGVVRLGEAFYKSNLERVGATEKLSLLLALCDRAELQQGDELWKSARALFDQRNALVHPKTREVDLDALAKDGGRKLTLVETATVSYRQMRRFYRLFPEYATEVGYKGRHLRGELNPAWFPDPTLVPPEHV